MKPSVPSLGVAAFLAAMVFTVSSAMAQIQGGGGSQSASTGGSQGGAGGTTGGTGGQTSAGTQGTKPPGNSGQQRSPLGSAGPSLFLQGKVILEDGTPAPSNIVIERSCGGQSVPVGQTDSKGRFSVELWRRNQSFIADASIASPTFGNPNTATPWHRGLWNRSLVDMEGCFLRGIYPGYVSSVVELAVLRKFNNPDLGTIILKKMGERSGYSVSMNSRQAPESAQEALRRGIIHAQEQKWDKAEEELEEALDLYPKYAAAWFNLGQVNEAQQKPEEARAAYGQALKADTEFHEPYINLAMMDTRENKWQDVAQNTDKVLKAKPYEFPVAYFLNSMANLYLSNNPAAERCAREAIEMDLTRRYPQVEYILGLALARQSKFDEARTHLQRYLEIAPNAPNVSLVRKQLAQVESSRSRLPSGAAPAQVGAPGQAPPQP